MSSIYKTEALNLSTIFHIIIFLIWFFLKYIYSPFSNQLLFPSLSPSIPQSKPDIILKLKQQCNDKTSPFNKTEANTSPFDITHQTQNLYTLSNTDPSYFTESLQGHNHGSQCFQSPTRPPYQSILSRYLCINLWIISFPIVLSINLKISFFIRFFYQFRDFNS